MIEIRSYRRVFDLERRIYRIDHMRLNPGGVPVRGAVYALAAAGAALLLRRLPIAGAVLGAAPWYLRDVAFPLMAGAFLSVLTIEGRPFHVAVPALLRPRRVAARRHGLVASPSYRQWSPGEVVLLPDGSDARLRSLRYDGPGAVLVAVAYRRSEGSRTPIARRRAVLELLPVAAGGQVKREVIWMARGARMVVAPRSRRRGA
ncbi:MAG TPA: hypothetical protein VHT27_05435 [Solirubrobacteraceae bacterium]|jgi:hypothetical protein|nr:hypothetical protein [Solirubrobacteraceae bacterium]